MHTYTHTQSCGCVVCSSFTMPFQLHYYCLRALDLCGPLSVRCIFRLSEASVSETEMTLEMLLLMTAGQSHNWLVDMSLPITDVSIGAEHWSWGKESAATSIIQLGVKLSTASSFYLAKLAAYSIWHMYEL